MTPAHIIERVRESTDFHSLVASYVALKKSGAQWLIQCLWHDDSEPSCRVYESHYHCFTCQAHGDCFSFLQAAEGLGFSEALRRLADRAGISLDQRPISRQAQRWAQEEAACCRWWWARFRARQLSLIHAVIETAEEPWLEALGAPLRWMDGLSVAERFAEFRARSTERDRAAWRAEMAEERAFAEAWMRCAA